MWSTRHEGMPTAHALATILLGKQHGESWGPARGWRSGIGDKTCFQGNLCHFAFYYSALDEKCVARHYAGTALPLPHPLPHPPRFEMAPDGTRVESSVMARRHEERDDASVQGKPLSSCQERATRHEERDDASVRGRRAAAGAGNMQQRVARSVISARLHQPRVWGRGGNPTAFDVDSFYRDLEKNPVFALTRRAFGGGSGVSRQVIFGTPKALFSPYGAGTSEYSISGSTIRTAPTGSGGGGGQVLSVRTNAHTHVDTHMHTRTHTHTRTHARIQ